MNRADRAGNRVSRARNNGWLVARGYIGDYGRNYLGRAVIALPALGANTPPETVYPVALTDCRGRPLTAATATRSASRAASCRPRTRSGR